MNPRIRLLVVDDHTLFRRGLVSLLGEDGHFSVVGEAADMGEALRAAGRLQPDLILLDNHMPGVSGIQGIASLKEAAPHARILMLTVSENENDLAAALQAGADGYLLKTVELDHLREFALRVLAGEPVVSPELMSKLVTAFRANGLHARAATPAGEPSPAPAVPAPALPEPGDRAALPDPLSTREREVLALLAHGHSNKQIARKLDIAETTVKIHVQHILRKLHLSSRVQAAVYAAGHRIE